MSWNVAKGRPCGAVIASCSPMQTAKCMERLAEIDTDQIGNIPLCTEPEPLLGSHLLSRAMRGLGLATACTAVVISTNKKEID